nr:UPF0280 family protein [Desulfobulbaceae bacterium]
MPSKQKKNKPSPGSYRQRNYRNRVDRSGLVSFEVQVRETDLHILATKDVRSKALHHVFELRNQLENYIAHYPEFLQSLKPLAFDPTAPAVVKDMMRASEKAGVGPMAAVAGVTAQYIGEILVREHGVQEIVVENGGDIFLQRSQDCRIAIFAGASPLSNKVGVLVKASQMPTGVCTSSATVGHSLSLGQADAVTVLARSTALADAVATRLGNETRNSQEIDLALEIGAAIEGIVGIVIICGEQLGAWGDIELVGV